MKTGEKIRYYRELLELTQDELAIRAGYKTRSSINKIEKGENDPSQKALKKIADALNVNPAILIDDTKTPKNVSLSESMGQLDYDRLEALHQNPRLGLLFDRQAKMTDADIEFMLSMANRILGERDGED